MSHVSVAYLFPCQMSNLRKGYMSHGTIIFSPCRMSLSLVSHVEFKKCPCRLVDFRGLGPYTYLQKASPPPPPTGSRILLVHKPPLPPPGIGDTIPLLFIVRPQQETETIGAYNQLVRS